MSAETPYDFLSVPLAADEIRELGDVNGRLYLFGCTADNVQIAIGDKGRLRTWKKKTGLDVPTGARQPKIWVKDTSGSANTLEIVVGTWPFKDGTVDMSTNGTEVDVKQDTHDSLNANANLQVGDADVDAANPVPTEPAQATHDDFNCNANLQVGDADVDAANPVPTEPAQATHDDFNCNANLQVGDADVDAANPVPTVGHGTDVQGHVSGHTNGAGDVSLLAAGGAGVVTALAALVVTETAGAAALVTIKDGSGGAALLTVNVGANGSAIVPLPRPIKGTANTALHVATSAGTVDVTATGYQE